MKISIQKGKNFTKFSRKFAKNTHIRKEKPFFVRKNGFRAFFVSDFYIEIICNVSYNS